MYTTVRIIFQLCRASFLFHPYLYCFMVILLPRRGPARVPFADVIRTLRVPPLHLHRQLFCRWSRKDRRMSYYDQLTLCSREPRLGALCLHSCIFCLLCGLILPLTAAPPRLPLPIFLGMPRSALRPDCFCQPAKHFPLVAAACQAGCRGISPRDAGLKG